jgi:hypothetical protein
MRQKMPTSPASVKEWADIIFGLIQTATIIGGGLFALYEYRRFRRYSPKIEFEVDFVTYGISDTPGSRLVDIAMTVKNMGQVRNYFPTIDVGVKSLQGEDVQAALEDGKRLRFGRELIPKHNIVAKPEDPWWVDGGVTQVFRYPVVIKESLDFVQVNAEFHYYKDKEGKKRIAYHQATCIKSAGKAKE